MKDCQHEHFAATVEVHRIARGEGGPIDVFVADLKVSCAQCKQELEFVGLPVGSSFYQPMASLNGDTARLPMVIPGAEVPSGLPGFRVRQQAFDDKTAVKQ